MAEEGASHPHDGEGRGVSPRPPRTLPVYACAAPTEGAPLGVAIGTATLDAGGVLTLRLRALPRDGVLRVPGCALAPDRTTP